MRATKSLCTDPQKLKSRLAVTDDELCYLLGTGRPTARKIAETANAVVFVGKRRLNNIHKIQDYLDSISG